MFLIRLLLLFLSPLYNLNEAVVVFAPQSEYKLQNLLWKYFFDPLRRKEILT